MPVFSILVNLGKGTYFMVIVRLELEAVDTSCCSSKVRLGIRYKGIT